MNKKLKAIIESAEPYKEGQLFDDLLIISAGKQYNGFWGKLEYNNFILVARDGITYKNYILNHDIDVVSIEEVHRLVGMDIPKDLNCVRMFPLGGRMSLEHCICSDVGIKFHDIKR